MVLLKRVFLSHCYYVVLCVRSLFSFSALCVLSSFCNHLDGEERAGYFTFVVL